MARASFFVRTIEFSSASQISFPKLENLSISYVESIRFEMSSEVVVCGLKWVALTLT